MVSYKGKKAKQDPCFTLHTKVTSRGIVDLNEKSKTKLLKENRRKSSRYHGRDIRITS